MQGLPRSRLTDSAYALTAIHCVYLQRLYQNACY